MGSTLFLAQAFGLYLTITAVSMFISKDAVVKRAKAMLSNDGTSFLVATVTLILGILLILVHNVWAPGWPVLITILAWLTFIKGVGRVVFPELDSRYIKMLDCKVTYYVAASLSLVIGLFLLYKGFL